jgi:hypothetical protein
VTSFPPSLSSYEEASLGVSIGDAETLFETTRTFGGQLQRHLTPPSLLDKSDGDGLLGVESVSYVSQLTVTNLVCTGKLAFTDREAWNRACTRISNVWPGSKFSGAARVVLFGVHIRTICTRLNVHMLIR